MAKTRSQGKTAPIRGYDNWTVGEMQKKLGRRSPDELRSLLDYEKSSKGRKGALEAIERVLESLAGDEESVEKPSVEKPSRGAKGGKSSAKSSSTKTGSSAKSAKGGSKVEAKRGKKAISQDETLDETETDEEEEQETPSRTAGVARFVQNVGKRVSEMLGKVRPKGVFSRENLMERLSEFLEHEKAGKQLYELGLEKVEDEEQRDRLQEFLEQTSQHVDILTSIIQDLGGDPDTLSESAELTRQKGEALLEADVEGDVGLLNYFQNLFIAEIVDHMNWEFLSKCMGSIDDEEVREVLERYVPDVEDEEDEHRNWAQKTLEECSLKLLFREESEDSVSETGSSSDADESAEEEEVVEEDEEEEEELDAVEDDDVDDEDTEAA